MLPTLTATTPLVRLTDCEIHIGTDEMLIRTGRMDLRCPSHGLSVLDAFSTPRPLGEVLLEIASRCGGGRQAMLDLTATIHDLYEAGVIYQPGQILADPRAQAGRFDSPELHISMLEDRTRTQAFLAAIEEVVQVGDIVLDIGTGTGILAMAAARAGAAHVYAIEAGHIGRSAQALFEANGLADKITLIPGWSLAVELPERADLLVSEILGSRPLSERIMPVTLDARNRLLKPNARLIPESLEVWGVPVEIPAPFVAQRRYTGEVVERWEDWYGLNFSPLLDFGAQLIQLDPQTTKDWIRLGPPVCFSRIELGHYLDPQINDQVTAAMDRPGRFDGFLVYFDLQLAGDHRITTDPTRCGSDCHWLNPIWLLPDPPRLAPGTSYSARFSNQVCEGGWVDIEWGQDRSG